MAEQLEILDVRTGGNCPGDVSVVSIHWGVEYEQQPRAEEGHAHAEQKQGDAGQEQRVVERRHVVAQHRLHPGQEDAGAAGRDRAVGGVARRARRTARRLAGRAGGLRRARLGPGVLYSGRTIPLQTGNQTGLSGAKIEVVAPGVSRSIPLRN